MKLDTEEKEILRSVESGEWRSIGVTERERTRYGQYAEATFRKDRRVNIRISRKDLEAIQKRALTPPGAFPILRLAHITARKIQPFSQSIRGTGQWVAIDI